MIDFSYKQNKSAGINNNSCSGFNIDEERKANMTNLKVRNIPFSPPDITDAEIREVVKAMKSGWITTGPRTKEFEIGRAHV